jgi:hypothetical protein
MKRALVLLTLAMFSVGLYGCHASVDTDTPANDTHYKKTTTYNDNGGTKTTETKTTVNP